MIFYLFRTFIRTFVSTFESTSVRTCSPPYINAVYSCTRSSFILVVIIYSLSAVFISKSLKRSAGPPHA